MPASAAKPLNRFGLQIGRALLDGVLALQHPAPLVEFVYPALHVDDFLIRSSLVYQDGADS